MLDGYASSTLELVRLQFAVTTSVHFLAAITRTQPTKLVDGGRLAEAQAQMVARYGPGDYAPPSWTLGAFDWMTTSGNLLFLIAAVGLVLMIRDWLIRVRGLRFMLAGRSR
jgi:cytochrome d ubiquinol oxidase subunit I